MKQLLTVSAQRIQEPAWAASTYCRQALFCALLADKAFETSFKAASAALEATPSLPDLVIIHGFDEAWTNLAHSRGLAYMIFTPLPLGLKGW